MRKLVGILVLLTVAGVSQGSIITGDTIAIDFGATSPTVANWNEMGSASPNIADAIRLSDGAATGVGVTLVGAAKNNGNNIPGNELNTTDVSIYGDGTIGNATVGGGNGILTITFTGLNDSLTYDLVGGLSRSALIGSFPTTWSVAGAADQSTDATATGGYVSFSGLNSSSGNLVITLTDISTYAGVAQINLSAVPEPATLGLVTAMGGGLLFIRRLMMM